MGRPCGVHFRHCLPRHALRLLLRPRLRLAHGRSIGVDRCAGLDVAHAAFWLHDGFRRSTLPPTRIAEPDHWSERGRVTSVGNSEALGRPIRSERVLKIAILALTLLYKLDASYKWEGCKRI